MCIFVCKSNFVISLLISLNLYVTLLCHVCVERTERFHHVDSTVGNCSTLCICLLEYNKKRTSRRSDLELISS